MNNIETHKLRRKKNFGPPTMMAINRLHKHTLQPIIKDFQRLITEKSTF